MDPMKILRIFLIIDNPEKIHQCVCVIIVVEERGGEGAEREREREREREKVWFK